MTTKAIDLVKLGAEIGADAWADAQKQVAILKQETDGLRADRDALTETNCEMRQLIQWAAREAATARFSTMHTDKEDAVIEIHEHLDYWLARNR